MIFLGIIYEPLSEPPVTKICEWGPWGLKALFLAPACLYSTSMTCLTLSSNVRLFIDDTTVHLTIHSDADSQVLQKTPRQVSELGNSLENEVPPGQIVQSAESRAQTRFNVPRLYTPRSNIQVSWGSNYTSDLRWNEHVNSMTNKANRTLGFL